MGAAALFRLAETAATTTVIATVARDSRSHDQPRPDQKRINRFFLLGAGRERCESQNK